MVEASTMADKTGISWTDATWNPVRGCSRVSEGCRNCYAERVAARFSGPGQPYEGLALHPASLRGSNRSKWTGVVRLIVEHLADPLRWKKPRRIFVNSMSDLFHESLTNEQIAAVFGVMAAAPQHTFQVLTKRAKRMREWFEWVEREAAKIDAQSNYVGDETDGGFVRAHVCSTETHEIIREGHIPSTVNCRWPLPNVWLGVSVENQEAADERIPELLRTPAAVRFLSCEPLIGLVDLTDRLGVWSNCPDCGRGVRLDEDGCCAMCGADAYHYGVHWVIAGCESGPGARECKVEWLRSLRDQCAAAGVPYFLKQAEGRSRHAIPGTRHIGAITDYHDPSDGAVGIGANSKRKSRGVIELPYLDGVQHAAFPEVSHG